MAKTYTVRLAGVDYPLSYKLACRRDIERKCGGQALGDVILKPTLDNQVALLWGGLKHLEQFADYDAVFVAVCAHVDDGGDLRPVVIVATRAAFAARLFGKAVDEKSIDRLFGKDEEADAAPAPVVPQ